MKHFLSILISFTAISISRAAPPLGARIVGGDDAVLGQVPYQASLFIAGEPNCGATILSEFYALTAMRCVCSTNSNKPWPAQMFSIRVGSTDLYSGGQLIVLAEITVNLNYSEFNTGIAILKLREPLRFSANVQPVALASIRPPEDANVDVSGFGRLKETDTQMYRTLQVNHATVVGNVECSRDLGKSLPESVICLGHSRKNGVCQGDFGGPAVYENQLVGVGAYVEGECGSALPDVFISVASYYDWIVEQMTPCAIECSQGEFMSFNTKW